MTAMSSRRTSSVISARQIATPAAPAKSNGTFIAVLTFLAGALVIALGIKTNITAIMGIGFVAFCCSLMYLNAMFWSKMYETGRLSQSYRIKHPPIV